MEKTKKAFHKSKCPICKKWIEWEGEENTYNVNTHIREKHLGIKENE